MLNMNFLSAVTIISCTLLIVSGKKAGIMQGDIIVAGLFQIYYGVDEQCRHVIDSSVQTLEAVKWMINMINDNQYIPGIKLGLVALPTCRLPSVANSNTFELIADMKYGVFNECSQYLESKPLVAMIGPVYSFLAQSTSVILSSLPPIERLLQVGFSTTASVLSDKETYKNFFRVIPSDDIQVEVMVALLEKLQWNYIAIIYEHDTYGKAASSFLNKVASRHHICVARTFPVTVNSNKQVSVIEMSRIMRSIITNNESPINGVVFFGTSFVANALLKTANTLHYTEKITFLFSEGVSFEESMFKDESGVMNAGKGSLVVSPPVYLIRDFTAYWKSLFTNITKLSSESKSNPWLVDMFEKHQKCKFGTKSCDEMTTGAIDKIHENSLFVGYAVKALLVIAKALKDLHEEYCGLKGLNQICPKFIKTLTEQRYRVIRKMNNLTVDFHKDFPAPLNETFTDPLQIKFEGTDSVPTIKSESVYEVFQYRQCLDQPDKYCLVKVGSYNSEGLHINEKLLKAYPDSKEHLPWAELKPAQCSEAHICSKCIPDTLPDQPYYEDGDMFVVGIIPVFSKDRKEPTRCNDIRTSYSVEIAEGFAFAVNKINNKTGRFSNLFPGKKVGFIILNSCNQALVIQNKILNLQNKGIQLANGSFVNVADRIIGYIGAYSSTISMAASELLTPLGYVQISYSATASVLSDRNTYPYFMRVCTSDDKQANSMIRIIKQLKNSNYIQVLYSEGAYGEGGRNAMRIQAKANKVCIANEISVTEGKYNGILDTLRMNVYAKIVVTFLQSYMAEEIVAELEEKMDYGEFMFIGSEAWGKTPEIITGRPKLVGSLTLSLEMADIPEFSTYVNSLDPATYKSDPWLNTYVEKKYGCYVSGSFDKSSNNKCPGNLRIASDPNFIQEQWTSFAINAVFALIMGANKTISDVCGTKSSFLCEDFRRKPEVLWINTVKQKLDIYQTGKVVPVFDDKGDGNAGYKIYNIQKSKINAQDMEYVEVGQSPLDESGFIFDKDRMEYADSIELPSVCPNGYVCNKCFEEQQTEDVTNRFVYSTEYKVFAGVTGVFGTVIIVLIIVIIVIIRQARQNPTPGVNNIVEEEPAYICPISSPDTGDYDTLDTVTHFARNDYE